MWWPAIGAVGVGVVGYFAPHTLGVGYDNIDNILNGSILGQTLIILFVLKFVSWAISLGSGTSGGTLAPLFTIGGGLGATLGAVIISLFPNSGWKPNMNCYSPPKAVINHEAALLFRKQISLMLIMLALIRQTLQPYLQVPQFLCRRLNLEIDL